MSEWGPPYGFAIRRNGSCLQEENYCVRAWNLTLTSEDFYRCCPGGETYCSAEHPGLCCPDKADCKRLISNPAHCANETWNLYENDEDGGYFCCEQGTTGFIRKNVGVGCAKKGDLSVSNTELLVAVSSGKMHILLTPYEPSSDITRCCCNIV